MPHSGGSLRQFFCHIIRFTAILCMSGDEIGEKEDFQNCKDDEQLDPNHEPKGAAERHRTEPLIVESEYGFQVFHVSQDSAAKIYAICIPTKEKDKNHITFGTRESTIRKTPDKARGLPGA